jgi:hypothetical protein
MVIISSRDKKMITWSFMEELCDKHMYASENNLSTDFNLGDFFNFGIFTRYLMRKNIRDIDGSSGPSLVLNTLKEYAKNKGLISLEGGILRLTHKGITERQKIHRDWDGFE